MDIATAQSEVGGDSWSLRPLQDEASKGEQASWGLHHLGPSSPHVGLLWAV